MVSGPRLRPTRSLRPLLSPAARGGERLLDLLRRKTHPDLELSRRLVQCPAAAAGEARAKSAADQTFRLTASLDLTTSAGPVGDCGRTWGGMLNWGLGVVG